MTLEPGEPELVDDPPPGQLPIPELASLTYQQSHSGPLPPASEFAAYDRALPGAAHRILRMAEKALDSRISSDRAADTREASLIDAQVKLSTRMQWITLVIVLAFFGLCAFAVAEGQQLAGAVFAVGGLATIAFALRSGGVRGTRQPRDDQTTEPAPDDGLAPDVGASERTLPSDGAERP